EGTLRSQIQGWVSSCQQILAANRGTRTASQPKCIRPPNGKLFRDNTGLTRISATNPNSDAACKFSFAYTSSTVGLSSGPTVNPGATNTEVCARPGETISF